ncbi:MAG: DUF2490 domain-containing protein [Salinivirgaceae bacterium]
MIENTIAFMIKNHLSKLILMPLLLLAFMPKHINAQELRGIAGIKYELGSVGFDTEFQTRRLSPTENKQSLLWSFGTEYALTDWLDVQAAYRYAASGQSGFYAESSIDYKNKDRVTFDAQLKSKRFDNELKLKNRLRYQINISNKGNVSHYIREKVSFEYKLTGLYRPFAEVEMYYDTDKEEVKALRLYLGSEFDMDKHVVSVTYIMEADVRSSIDLLYMLELAYSFEL